MYEWLKWIHVVLAVTWVGGGLTILLMGGRIRRGNDPVRVVEYGGVAEWVGTHVYLPASLLLLAAGVWMVIDSPSIDWEDPWIVIGLAGWLFSALIGSLYLGPQAKKLKLEREAGSLTDEALLARIDRVVNVQRVEQLVFFIVIWAMVVKPGA